MVGVPSALYLAAGLLAVAVSVGLSIALLGGALGWGGRERDVQGLIGGSGAAVYAVSHVLAGAQIGPVGVWSWLHVVGLAGIAIGVGPDRIRPLSGLPLVIPVVSVVPAYAAAAAGLVAAVRIGTAGRRAISAALGLAVMALGHAIGPTEPVYSEIAIVVGALLLGAWLWAASSRRILTKLLTAFVAALLAMAILLAAVLATVSSAELTAQELDRLGRLAAQLTDEVEAWPAEAVAAASPLSRSVGPLIATRLSAADAADLFALSLANQDFFLTVDASGQVVNSHPPDLPGSLRLAVSGDPLVTGLREGGAGGSAGSLLSSGGVVVGIGAVAVREVDTRPEDPPAGVLVTGRLVDGVWAAQQATALDVGLIGVVGVEVVFTTEQVEVAGAAVVEGLDGRAQADLSVDEAVLFAGAAPIADPQRGTALGQVITISTPDVIASVERTQAQRLFLVALFGGVLAVVVAALVTRRSLRPIGQLTAAAELVGSGDLGGRAAIDSPDEVGVLGAAFDEMVASLAEQQADLTSSAQREARLRGRLESLTSSMGDGLIAVDVGGAIITFNPAAEALTGRRAAEVEGVRLAQVLRGAVVDEGPGPEGSDGGDGVDGGDAPDPLGVDDATDARPAAARLVLRRVDGSQVPVAATAAPVRSPAGDIIGRVYVLRDISRDLEVEQMKTEFLANVSHELRTPITPIKGYAGVLARRDVGPEKTQRFATEILDSTRRLERIVGMIVDFAGLDSGRVVLRREPVDLAVLVDGALDRWRTAHPDRGFTRRIQPWLPTVWGDPEYLARCLEELLDNAVKFSPDGEDVAVAARTRDGCVELQVIDAGIGIEPAAADRLFRDFVQVDGTETRHFGGLGLGLGLVKRILDGIGARVSVRSAPGAGTTVTLVLDIAGPALIPPLPVPPLPRGVVPVPPV